MGVCVCVCVRVCLGRIVSDWGVFYCVVVGEACLGVLSAIWPELGKGNQKMCQTDSHDVI